MTVNLHSLRNSVLLAGCSGDDLSRLGEIAVTRDFRDREQLFAQGSEATELMVVSEGKVQLELSVSVLGQMRDIAFEVKERGSVVGWSTLARPSRLTLSGRALGDTRVIAFPQSDLSTLFTVDPELASRILQNVLSIARKRLERARAMWISEVQRSLDERYR